MLFLLLQSFQLALVLVLLPFIGREVNGARRWLALGFFNLQPSEFVKLAAVLYAADYTVRKQAEMHSFKRGLLPMLGVMLIVSLSLRPPRTEIREPFAATRSEINTLALLAKTSVAQGEELNRERDVRRRAEEGCVSQQ